MGIRQQELEKLNNLSVSQLIETLLTSDGKGRIIKSLALEVLVKHPDFVNYRGYYDPKEKNDAVH